MEKKKEAKKRAEKYDEKVAVKGTLEQLISVAVKDTKKKDNN